MIQKLMSQFKKRKLKRPELASMFEPPTPEQWVAIDCEMTGLNPKRHHLLSVAAIHIDGNKIDTGNGLHLICKPPEMPNRDTIVIHGLRAADVAYGMSYHEMLELLLPFIGNRVIVGFCPQIDLAFLNPLVKPYLGTPLPNQVIDIAQVFGKKIGSYDPNFPAPSQHLTQILAHYRIPNLGDHDAYNDALMTAMAFLHMRSP